jgi:hypothetical protein
MRLIDPVQQPPCREGIDATAPNTASQAPEATPPPA